MCNLWMVARWGFHQRTGKRCRKFMELKVVGDKKRRRWTTIPWTGECFPTKGSAERYIKRVLWDRDLQLHHAFEFVGNQ